MKRITSLIFIAIILSLFVFHWKNINSFPTKIHSWAQSDRYALALGFINNDFDFFHPQTYNYTESPDHKLIPKETSITAVDFPINDFSAALLMKLFGTTDPWCFRLYSLVYSLIGMFFLFLLSMQFIKNRLLSMSVVLFCITSPVYLYYQIGFLPTIPAISNLFIGLYFFFKYLDTKRIWHYSLSIFFITIAILSRKPFLIFLLAIMAFELWGALKSKKLNGGITLTLLISTITIFGYFLYNRYLQQRYGAAFLGSILPPESIGSSFEISQKVFKNWLFQYFSGYHYFILVALVIITGVLFYLKKTVSSFNRKILFIYIAITFVGFLGYYILMMKQFPDHDYYFLDSFYPVVCFLLIYLISRIPLDSKKADVLGVLGVVFFLILLFTINKHVEQKREETGFWDRVEITTNNFEGADKFLNENNIPATARILVIDSYTANIPFIKMKRFGYAMMSKRPEDIKKSLAWNYDYVVLQDCFTLSDIVRNYPPILNELKRIAGNGKISIYKKQKSEATIGALAFIGLDSKIPVLVKDFDFDSTPDSCWQNIYSRVLPNSPFTRSGILTDSIMFSTTLSLKNIDLLARDPNVLYVSIDVFSEEKLNSSRIVASIDEDGKSTYYNVFELADMVDTLSTWKHLQMVYPILPQLKSKNNELKVFIWNDGKHLLYYDNIHVALYK